MQDTSGKNDLDFFGRNINIPIKNVRTISLARTSQSSSTDVYSTVILYRLA